MNRARSPVLMLTLLVCFRGILAVEITEKSAEAYLRYEYNRTFRHTGDVSAVGELRLDSVYGVRAGFAYGELDGGADIRMFAGGGAAPFARAKLRPLNFRLLWVYNGLPAYETHAHAILPITSYNTRRAGVSIGPSFRFTSFFGESAIFEYVAEWTLYVNIVNNEKLRVGLSAGNLDEFYVGSKGVHSPRLTVDARAGRNWRIINDLEYLQSGGDGLAAVYYGIVWRGGVKYTW